jgi:hypothetical protein
MADWLARPELIPQASPCLRRDKAGMHRDNLRDNAGPLSVMVFIFGCIF